MKFQTVTMKSLLVFLVTFVAFSAGADEDVLELDDDDFASTLKQHETTLVMFYAPWCGFCQRLEPEYLHAAAMIKDDEPPIKLARIDCTEAGREICNKYDIKSYPTLKIFRQAEVFQDYKGPRKAAAIAKFMRHQSMAQLAQFQDNNKDMAYDTAYDSNVVVKTMRKNRFNDANYH